MEPGVRVRGWKRALCISFGLPQSLRGNDGYLVCGAIPY
jgi:hypothetical protein